MSDSENSPPVEDPRASREPQAEAGAAPAEERIPMPPASLEFLMLSLRTQAELQLGLIHFGAEEDKPKPDFDLARHSIDMLAMLREKTKGNLTLEEQRLLENSLTELRFRYVHAVEESKKS